MRYTILVFTFLLITSALRGQVFDACQKCQDIIAQENKTLASLKAQKQQFTSQLLGIKLSQEGLKQLSTQMQTATANKDVQAQSKIANQIQFLNAALSLQATSQALRQQRRALCKQCKDSVDQVQQLVEEASRQLEE